MKTSDRSNTYNNNSIPGGFGDHFIAGGLGNDVLTDGGANKFIFNSLADAVNTIIDYNFGQKDVTQVSKVG